MSHTLAAWLMALVAAALLYLFLRHGDDDDNDIDGTPTAPVTGGQLDPHAPV